MAAQLVLLAIAFGATTVGITIYGRIAARVGILAVPNERTLHEKPTIRGAGVVVAVVFLVTLVWLYATGTLPGRWFGALFGGGLVASALGFIDDIVHLSTGTRIVVHAALAAFALAWIGEPLGLGIVGYALTFVGVIWMINLYNFLDGIDGMAASGAVLFTGVLAAILEVRGGSPLSIPLAVLGAATLAFLLFNWPPARMFMGDSGSGFYGYIFAVLVMISVRRGELSVWTWLIVMGYFVADTTTTTTIRAFTVPRFWGTHRSHAYQNLARVWQNHRRMTGLVIAIEALWLTPLAIASVTWPAFAPVLAAVALTPLVAFAVKYGPLYDR
jgi:Fuc2NAc and GlcNAc transferase